MLIFKWLALWEKITSVTSYYSYKKLWESDSETKSLSTSVDSISVNRNKVSFPGKQRAVLVFLLLKESCIQRCMEVFLHTSLEKKKNYLKAKKQNREGLTLERVE